MNWFKKQYEKHIEKSVEKNITKQGHIMEEYMHSSYYMQCWEDARKAVETYSASEKSPLDLKILINELYEKKDMCTKSLGSHDEFDVFGEMRHFHYRELEFLIRYKMQCSILEVIAPEGVDGKHAVQDR